MKKKCMEKNCIRKTINKYELAAYDANILPKSIQELRAPFSFLVEN